MTASPERGDRPLRVALLVTDHERGGSPLRLARLAIGLRNAGVDVFAGCLAPRGPVSDELEREGIPTFSCDARGARDFAALGRLSRHLKRIRPDLIHATLTHANVAARLVGAWLRIPVIGSTATIEVERRWHRWAERATIWLERAHVVNSAAVAAHVRAAFRISAERVFLIPPMPASRPPAPPKDAARAALGLPLDTPVVAWVGRLDPVKRVGLLVRAAEVLEDLHVHLLLAGDGPQRAEIEALRTASPTRERVHLLGWRSDVEAVFAAADIFALPSLTEGVPNALLEALAAGLPAIASDIPTLREIAAACPAVRLVAGADAGAVAAALCELLGDRERLADLSRSAVEWSRAAHAPALAVEALLHVYRGVCSSSKRSARAK